MDFWSFVSAALWALGCIAAGYFLRGSGARVIKNRRKAPRGHSHDAVDYSRYDREPPANFLPEEKELWESLRQRPQESAPQKRTWGGGKG